MKKSREFDNILDECLERLLVQGETLEQCLQGFPEQAGELKPLLEMALSAREASAIQPRPEFRDKARHQFLLALRDMESKKSRSFFSWLRQPQWVTAVAIVLALLLAGSGTVVAADGSMPDEALYPVKLATEQVRLALTPSALGKAEFYARLVEKRVIEIVNMADKSKPEKIERAARRLNTHLAKIAVLASSGERIGAELMVPAPISAPAVERAPVVIEAPASEEARPAEEAPVIKAAPPMPGRGGGGGVAMAKASRRAKLRAIMLHYAINHPERLRALLKKVPPSARPALQRAIDASEAGYEKALKSLDRP